MKKIATFLLLFSLLSCDDGDFEIPSFQFSETLQSCGSYVLYRTNTAKNEALVLVLNTTVIKNQVSTTPITLAITPSNTQYRIFDGVIGTDYFCQTLPPTRPFVLKTWEGVAGTSSFIQIETTQNLNTNAELIGYKHRITLLNMRLQNGTDLITYQTYSFGTFLTSI